MCALCNYSRLMFCRETWQCDKCRGKLHNMSENIMCIKYYGKHKHNTENLKSFRTDKTECMRVSWLFKSVIKLIFIHSHRIIVHFASVWCFSLLLAPEHQRQYVILIYQQSSITIPFIIFWFFLFTLAGLSRSLHHRVWLVSIDCWFLFIKYSSGLSLSSSLI